MVGQRIGDLLQRDIAVLVAVVIVIGAEGIDIDHRHGVGLLLALGIVMGIFQRVFQRMAIEQPGQTIQTRRIAQ